jgi:hypothetical protein
VLLHDHSIPLQYILENPPEALTSMLLTSNILSKKVSHGFVAQIGLSLDFPLPRTDLAYGHGTRYAKSCEAIQDRGADLDLRNLSIEVARCEALTEEFHTMHLCFDAAAAVVSGQVSP